MKIYKKYEFTEKEIFSAERPDLEKKKAFAETDKKVDLGDILKIGRSYWEVCMINVIEPYAVVRSSDYDPKKIDKDPDPYDSTELTCPYCRKEIEDAFEIEDGEITCPNCKSKVKMWSEKIRYYHVEPVHGPEIIKL